MTQKNVRELMGTFMKDHGFIQEGKSFVKREGDVLKIVELQKYSFKLDGVTAFTINVGLFVDESYQAVFGLTPKQPTCANAILFCNIGEILSGFKGRVINKSWKYENVEALQEEIQLIIKNSVYSFLLSFNDPCSIYRFLSTKSIVSKSTYSVQMQMEHLREKCSE